MPLWRYSCGGNYKSRLCKTSYKQIYDEPRKGRKIISIEVVVDEFRGWWSMGWSYKAQRYFCDFLTKKRRPIF